MKVGEFLKKAAAAVFAGDAGAQPAALTIMPGPHVLLAPGKHTIQWTPSSGSPRLPEHSQEVVTVLIEGEPGTQVRYPLPRWGRYVIDSRIFYAHDPAAGIRLGIGP
ncbi:MAG TPA: hypothetical protein VGR92_06090 [Steroidobacteraceae bacterium]|nr:hypothetical protein [Steroidobacteraceae bacterium]